MTETPWLAWIQFCEQAETSTIPVHSWAVLAARFQERTGESITADEVEAIFRKGSDR